MKIFHKTKRKPIDYHFKAKNHIDYELEFTLHVENKLLNKMFLQSLKELKKRKNIDTDADLTKIRKFKIEPKFFKLLKITLKKQYRETKAKLSKNKIVLANAEVILGLFERDKNEDWIIKIKFGGQYVDKR